MPDVLPHLLELLSRRSVAVSAAAAPLSAAVHALEILAPNLLDYFFLVIPPLIKLSADVDVVLSVRLQCVRALAALVHTPLNQLVNSCFFSSCGSFVLTESVTDV